VNPKLHENPAAVSRLARALANGEKTVPIIGAGTSIPAGVPGGYYMMQRMRRKLITIRETHAFKDKLGPRLEEAKQGLAADAAIPSFEWILRVYSDMYGPEGLYEWVREFVPARNTAYRNPPYFPTFSHEFLAHLVGVGILNCCITANFDEVLETALEDEVGRASFLTVASESEFERFSNVPFGNWSSEVEDRRIHSFVLKPHGTISRRLSLRYTPEGVDILSRAKRNVLKEALEGALVVFLGFGNYNEDFWLLFGEAQAGDIIIVDPEPDRVCAKLTGNGPQWAVHTYAGNSDDFFREVCERLYGEHLGLRAKPLRHEIRTCFFELFARRLADVDRDEQSHRKFLSQLSSLTPAWFAARVYELELLIYLFKTRGLFVDLAVADCLRIRQALERCLSLKEQGNFFGDLRPYSVLAQFLNSVGQPVVGFSPLRDRLSMEALGTNWIFLITPHSLRPSLQALADLSEIVTERYVCHLKDCLLDAGCELEAGDWNSRLKRFAQALPVYFQQLTLTFDVDISQDDLSAVLRFASAKRIRRRREFGDIISGLLRTAKWNHLRIATVAAEWHAQQLESVPAASKQGPCWIEIMSNLDMFTEKRDGPSSMLPDGGPGQVYHYQQLLDSVVRLIKSLWAWNQVTLDWFGYRNLEHHLTLISQKPSAHSRKKESFLGGTYFRRPGKNTTVTPVFLGAQDDMGELARYFDRRIELASNGSMWQRGIGRIFRAEKQGKRLVVKISRDPGAAILLDTFAAELRRRLVDEREEVEVLRG
jgi:hypothetical protein